MKIIYLSDADFLMVEIDSIQQALHWPEAKTRTATIFSLNAFRGSEKCQNGSLSI
jgi:hypothetical protein